MADGSKDGDKYADNFDRMKLADDIRRFEIQHYWTRSAYFTAVLGAAATGIKFLEADPFLRLLLWCFGLICAVAWCLAMRGAKYWYETWEEHGLDRSELANLKQKKLRGRGEVYRWSGFRYSPSRLAMAVCDAALLGWLAAGVYILWPSICSSCRCAASADLSPPTAIAVGGVTMFWIGRMFCEGRGGTDDPKTVETRREPAASEKPATPPAQTDQTTAP